MVIVKSLISSIFSDMHIIDIAYLFAQSYVIKQNSCKLLCSKYSE